VTIEFKCSCGAVCRAEESEVGHLHHCEACGLDVPVPPAEEAEASLQAEAAGEEVVAAPAEDAEPAAEAENPENAEAEEATEAPQGEPTDAGSGLDDLRSQVMSEEEAAHAAEEAKAHEEAAGALRDQLGGGGLGDIAAHLRDGESEDEQAAAASEADKRRGDAEALRQQLGGGGAADLAAAMRGEDLPQAAGDPGAGPAIAAAGIGPTAARRPPARKKVLRGYERAAHHITFKRAIWLPSLLVGLLCIAVGVGAGVFRIHPMEIPDLVAGKPDVYKQHLALFHAKLKEANIPVDGYEIVEHGRDLWAVPTGAKIRKTATGRVYYTNDAGFDEPALNAEDFAKSQAVEQGRTSGLMTYGLLLGGVGLALLLLSLITVRDVRMVAKGRAKEAPEAEEAAGEEPAADAEGGEPAEAEAVPESEDADEEAPVAEEVEEDEASEEKAGADRPDQATDASPETTPADAPTDETAPEAEPTDEEVSGPA